MGSDITRNSLDFTRTVGDENTIHSTHIAHERQKKNLDDEVKYVVRVTYSACDIGSNNHRRQPFVGENVTTETAVHRCSDGTLSNYWGRTRIVRPIYTTCTLCYARARSVDTNCRRRRRPVDAGSDVLATAGRTRKRSETDATGLQSTLGRTFFTGSEKVMSNLYNDSPYCLPVGHDLG